MTTTQIRPSAIPRPREGASTPESQRVADLQEMIRSGRYVGYLDDLKDELDKARAARAEVVDLTATTVLGA